MKKKNKNIVRYKKEYYWNPSVVFIAGLFIIYIIVVIIAYVNQKHISPYLVEESSIANSDVYTGLIIRDETIVNSEGSGYINYYVQDGERAAAGATVYTIDETGKFTELLSESLSQGSQTLASSQWYSLKDSLYDLATGYSGNHFSDVYNVKNKINNTIVTYYFDSAISNLNDSIDTSGYLQFKNKASSIILLGIDGFETFNEATINAKDFDREAYAATSIQSGTLVTEGNPIYKEVTTDSWKLYFPITEQNEDQITRTASTITLYFTKTNETVSVPFTIIQNSDQEEYVCCSFTKGGYNYLTSRYLSFRIVNDTVNGLKIPKSALVTMNFFVIPNSYKTFSTKSSMGFNVVTTDATINNLGEPDATFLSPDIYATIDQEYYVSMSAFNVGDYIISNESLERYYIGPTKSLTGVYCINQGYTQFRRVEILAEIDDTYIIKNNTSYGINVYDHIALDASDLTEYELIN